MEEMRLMRHPVEFSVVYRLWMAPFADRKLAPMLRHIDLRDVNRVLDVGCGPGTNAGCFQGCDYLGVDINPAYIRSAERRHGPKFRVADVTSMRIEPGQGYDLILVNSLLHHLSDPDVDRLLAHLVTLIAEKGAIHIMELVLPERRSVARFLARKDRGEFPRSLDAWREIFTRHFTPAVFEPFALRAMGVTLWEMVYFQGRRPTH